MVKECLERDLISLQAAMWRKSNEETKKRRIVETDLAALVMAASVPDAERYADTYGIEQGGATRSRAR
jgi:hypothetical protein